MTVAFQEGDLSQENLILSTGLLITVMNRQNLHRLQTTIGDGKQGWPDRSYSCFKLAGVSIDIACLIYRDHNHLPLAASAPVTRFIDGF